MAFKALTSEEFAAKMEQRSMTVDGKEVPDPRPMRPSIRVQRMPSMFDIHRQRMEQERMFRQMAEDETEDDLRDFGPDTDDDLVERLSEYEKGDLELTLHELERSDASKSVPKPVAPSGDEPVDKPAGGGTDGPGVVQVERTPPAAEPKR